MTQSAKKLTGTNIKRLAKTNLDNEIWKKEVKEEDIILGIGTRGHPKKREMCSLVRLLTGIQGDGKECI